MNWKKEKDNLEFYKIKEKWMELALTQAAKEEIQGMMPYLSETLLRAKQRETSEARALIEKGGNPPLVTLNGIQELLTVAEKGGCLNAAELETIENALVAVKRLKEYLIRCKSFGESLPYYEENLDWQEELKERIRQQIRNGGVADEASKLLKSMRSDIGRAEDKMREKAEAVLRSNKECMSDSFSTIRNGHVCIPVKKEYKFKISGTVIDKSSTGNTLFIEPASAARYFEELQYLRIDEENEERRILYELTAMVAEAAPVMEKNQRTLEKLDFIFSKGKFSIDCDGTEPKINTGRKIRIQNGRHPLMERDICVPLQFEIGNEVRGVIITGPNTGGKTVAIKTVALTCLMAQCGLHVACEEAEVCMNSNVLCDIGDGQNLSENLSTFSAHITNVLDILKKVNSESLVILDELGSGTDPAEGMGIATAILEELRKSGALFLVTTHYPEVKQFAQKTEGIQNARMTFDKESLRPLYQLIQGEAGESCAFYIARRLGMPDSMLRVAAAASYGKAVHDDAGGQGTSGMQKEASPRIQKKKEGKEKQKAAMKFQVGDSVMVYPDKKVGIVCRTSDEQGVLRVQLPDKKININHKRLKLLVAAEKLYPADYDFSIVFDTKENRKLRHQMERKYVEGEEIQIKEEDC